MTTATTTTTAPPPTGAVITTTTAEQDDPRDRYVGTWKLMRKMGTAPWYLLDGTTNINYNADGDLVLHTECEIGVKWLGLKKRMDSGFARVDAKGHFKCQHTKDHLEFQIYPDNENKADMKEFNGDKVITHLKWIRMT